MSKESQGYWGNLFTNILLLIVGPFVGLVGFFIALFGGDDGWYWLIDFFLESDLLAPMTYAPAKLTFN